jgi:predicted nucleic acid-binding protein
LVDVHLLASCAVGEVALWTKDARLMKAARQLGLGEV